MFSIILLVEKNIRWIRKIRRASQNWSWWNFDDDRRNAQNWNEVKGKVVEKPAVEELVVTILLEKALPSCSSGVLALFIIPPSSSTSSTMSSWRPFWLLQASTSGIVFQWKLLNLNLFLRACVWCGHMAVKIKPPRLSLVKNHLNLVKQSAAIAKSMIGNDPFSFEATFHNVPGENGFS